MSAADYTVGNELTAPLEVVELQGDMAGGTVAPPKLKCPHLPTAGAPGLHWIFVLIEKFSRCLKETSASCPELERETAFNSHEC